MRKFAEMTSDELDVIIKKFINTLVLDFGDTSISSDELNYIKIRLKEVLSETGYTQKLLDSILIEMTSNYGKYRKICYASIKTAKCNLE